MSWINIVWPMIAAACLTLALIYLGIWLKQRSRYAWLAFAVLATSVATLTVFEWLLMRAPTVERYAAVVHWLHVPLFVGVVSVVAFVRFYFHTGNVALGWAICLIRALDLVLNFTTGTNVNYLEITQLHTLSILGDSVAVAEGIRNPWTRIDDLDNVLLLAFVGNAWYEVWRRGDKERRRSAAVICGSLAFLIVVAAGAATLIHSGVVRMPYLVAVPFLVVVASMGYELGLDVLRAAELAERLQASIAENRLAELEAASRRDELTHLSRVAMLGELSGSLAHELNQPLAAILSNAQAMQRYLARDPVPMDEVRETLADIVANDKRAGEVIRRLRVLLKKEEPQYDVLEINEIIEDVLRLMRSDLSNRQVTVDAELAHGLSPVRGDRVQLQQVLLNLIINGCDAMDGAVSHRSLILRTAPSDGGVEISVVDQGTGIPATDLEHIFEPFVTTKAHGMGLGLAICRTIVKGHGGRMWATNNNPRGATLHFTLPADRSS